MKKILIASMIAGLFSATGLGFSGQKPSPPVSLKVDLTQPQIVMTAEYMTVEQLLDPKVIGLAARRKLMIAPCIWPENLGEELHRLMTIYEQNGIQLVFWPQLSRDHCLYLNKEYAEEYLAYLDAIYAWADKYGHHIDALIVDIEPPDCQPGSDLGPAPSEVRLVLDQQTFGTVLGGIGKKSFDASIPKFQAVLDKLHQHGTLAISTAMDYAAVDLAINRPVLQDVAGGPSLLIQWDMFSFMNFGTANYDSLKKIGFSRKDVRYLSYLLSQQAFQAYGTRVGMSIGQTIPGEGHASVYTEPEPLGLDAGAIKAAGIIHFAIYDLQGVVDKPDPDAWILAVKDAPPQKPPYSIKAVMLWNTIKAAAWVGEIYRTANGR